MYKLNLLAFFLMLLFSCIDKKNPQPGNNLNRIVLNSDSVNLVKVTDTLLIQEGTCRGCEYEKSTHFAISDSLGIIKLLHVVTTDNSPSNTDGGSIQKDLILVPQKTGSTVIKVYKFWEENETAEDSSKFTLYSIKVQN